MQSAVRALSINTPRASIRTSLLSIIRAMSTSSSLPPSPPAKRVRGASPSTPMESIAIDTPSIASIATVSAPSSSKPAHNDKISKFINGKGKRRRNRRPLPDPYSSADVLYHDVSDFLGREYVNGVLSRGDDSEWEPPQGLELYSVVELAPSSFTVSGESLSMYASEDKKWAVVVPFAHPKDRIRAKIYKHDRLCSFGDLVEIVEYCDDMRGGEGDRRVHPENGCKYFGECGGCQLQPVPYELQLKHKRRTVDLAYQRFSTLSTDKVPTILPTIGSPKQWGYRTKITPHFDAPPKWARPAARAATAIEEESMNERTWECRIGFERKGRPGVLDIEECPIATSVLNEKLTGERKRVQETIMTFARGATLLLRDSIPEPSPVPSADNPFDPETASSDEVHIAITNHKAAVYERVGPFMFSFAAGSFFQNNNSILIPLTEYVKEAIFPAASTAPRPTHLVDTYCGSGLFGITLSPEFERVAGVEISQDSITAAKKNAGMNGLSGKTEWLCGKAEDIFGGLADKGFAGGHSCVVVDPPRKGCDTPFLEQLLAFRPLTVVYVSCNVHTQARDIGWLVNESERRGDGKWKYELESLRGFDLFPQTAHVESVGVLRLVE